MCVQSSTYCRPTIRHTLIHSTTVWENFVQWSRLQLTVCELEWVNLSLYIFLQSHQTLLCFFRKRFASFVCLFILLINNYITRNYIYQVSFPNKQVRIRTVRVKWSYYGFGKLHSVYSVRPVNITFMGLKAMFCHWIHRET